MRLAVSSSNKCKKFVSSHYYYFTSFHYHTGSRDRVRGLSEKKGFPLGNYPDYYSFRQKQNKGEDSRMSILKEEWFKDKRVLDIGCNSGWLTMEIAFRFGCKEILGVDIDGSLIKKANTQLQARLQNANLQSSKNVLQDLQPSQTIPSTPLSNSTLLDNNISTLDINISTLSKPIPSITFLEENFIYNTRENDLFDTVTCFSVSKWIHLNWGDEGILQLFRQVRKSLRPGGYFVFEPQEIESYYMNTTDCSHTTTKNKTRNKIEPDQFTSILQNRFGFQYVQEFKIFKQQQRSFNRAVRIFQKPQKFT